MFSYMLGIQPDEKDPGYHSIVLTPRPGGTFTYAKGWYDSVYGRIESGWRRIDGDGVEYSFVVPANTKAHLLLPCAEGGSVQPGEGAKYARPLDAPGHYELPSGRYTFTVK